jgi:hypothetical protein
MSQVTQSLQDNQPVTLRQFALSFVSVTMLGRLLDGKPIPESFKPEQHYYSDVTGAQDKLSQFLSLSTQEMQAQFESESALSKECTRKCEADAAITRARFEAMIAKASAWRVPDVLAEYKANMIKHLEEGIAVYCAQQKPSPEVFFEEWKTETLEYLARRIRNAEGHLEAHLARCAQLTAFVQALHTSLPAEGDPSDVPVGGESPVPLCAYCKVRPLAYPGALYCGAGCSARAEAHEPLTSEFLRQAMGGFKTAASNYGLQAEVARQAVKPMADAMAKAQEALGLHVEVAMGDLMFLTTSPQEQKKPVITARFHPQVWVGGQAVDSESHGEVKWDATADVLSFGRDYAISLKDNSRDSDVLAYMPSAPEWVRKWTHNNPYRVEVAASIRAYFAAETPVSTEGEDIAGQFGK